MYFLILLIFAQNAKSFYLQVCQPNDSGCNDQIFDESNYTSESVNKILQQDSSFYVIYINQTDILNDVVINLDGLDSFFNIFFNTLSKRITLQTRISHYSNGYTGPTIYASNLDITIENLDESSDKTVFIYHSFRFKTVTPKNPQKPLYLISTSFYNVDYGYGYSVSLPSSINSNLVYYGPQVFSINLNDEIADSFTIILSPISIKISEWDARAHYEISISSPSDLRIIYGNNKISFEYPNNKTVTIISETHRVQVLIDPSSSTIITVEEDATPNNLIAPEIISRFISDKGSPTIEGNWPIIKTCYIEGGFSEDGLEISDFYKNYRISGKFFFSATNFPLDYFEKVELILTSKSSSINYLHNRLYENLTLRTEEEDVDTFFYINGRPTESRVDYYYHNRYINTNSPKLTIFANTKSKIFISGPAKLIYKEIDNSFKGVNSTLDFQRGGTLTLPFGVDYEELFSKIDDIFHSYVDEFDDKGMATGEIANFFIGFVRDKILDLSELIQNAANQVFAPVTINQIDSFSDPDAKSTIVLNRADFPVSTLYQNGLNNVVKSICIEEGKINMSQWKVKPGTNFIRGFVETDDTSDLIFDKILPTFSSTTVSFVTSLIEDDRCIGIQLKSVPASNFEIIIYTTNETYFEILEKVDLFTVLSSSDLDAYSKLRNKNSKNFLVVVLDDLPEGSSINLKGIRSTSNIFLVGFKSATIDDIYELADNLNSLDWDVGDEEYYRQEAEYWTRITSKIGKYRPKASISFNTVGSFLISTCEYFGTHIKCTRFWPFLSNFSNLDALSNDFSCQMTVTESITYNSISSLKLTDLVLFPVSISPPNIFSVDMINVTESQWSLHLACIYDNFGYRVDSVTYTIDKAKVTGKLYIYSFSTKCILNAPDTKENQKLKGYAYKNLNPYNIVIKDIPGMITFEDNNDRFNNVFKLFKRILFNPSLFEEENHPEKESNVFKFIGNWDKVQEIEGSIEIDTGSSPLIVEDIPTVVAQVLEVKSEQSINLTTESSKIEFSQSQIVSREKTIRFNKNTDVTFSNITFNGDSPRLSLLIDDKNSKIVTNHVLVETQTMASVTGQLEVKKSFEFYPQSSLSAPSISAQSPQLKLNYRFEEAFATIPDSIEPEMIVLNYIGESDSQNELSSFLGSVKKVKKFTGNGHNDRCKKWKDKATFESTNFPEFRGENRFVSKVCITEDGASTFAVNVTAVPEGTVEVGPGNDDKEEEDDDNDGNGINNSGGSGGKGKGKGLGTGAIIGIVVAVIVLVAIVSVLVWYFVFYRKKKDARESSRGENAAENVNNRNSEEQSENEFSVGIVEYVE